MIPNLSEPSGWLPLFFLVAMGIAMVAYVVLDGYDLGVGILLNQASESEKDIMISSIGPFWDANETWLVLGVGILLIAFPMAHGIILTELYLPVGIMLAGLILRGVSFDFRAKAHLSQKSIWNFLFFFGSFLAAASQGVMVSVLLPSSVVQSLVQPVGFLRHAFQPVAVPSDVVPLTVIEVKFLLYC